MSITWKEIQLGEFISTQKGYAFKSAWYQEDGTMIIRVSDFTADSIDTSTAFKIDNAIAKEYSRYKLKKGDSIVQTVGSWGSNPNSIVGKVVKVPKNASDSLLNQNAVKLVAKEGIDSSFLYYRLKDKSFEGHILNFAQGAANQASITLSSIREFKFKLPPLPTQQKIARLLSRYDDLIENNLRRIKLLEELARVTYEEWFVRGRKSDELPNGWVRTKLGEILTLNYGKALKKSIRQPGPFPVYGSSGNVGSHTSAKVSAPGLIVGRKGNVGSVFWSELDFWPIDTVYYVSSNLSLYYLYFLLKSMTFVNNDAAVPGLNREAGYRKKVALPPKEMIASFEDKIKPYFDVIRKLSSQNTHLREARDLLLPRLMAGVVDLD